MKTLLASLIALMLSSVLNAASTITGLYFEPGKATSYIAGFKTVGGTLILEEDPLWTFKAPVHIYPDLNAEYFSISSGYNINSWVLSIQMPEDQLLHTGKFIGTRFPFNPTNLAGFDWGGYGRGCNTSTTYFEILEAKYTDGKLTSLAVDFTQFEEVRTTVGLSLETNRGAFGSFRYNSTVAIVPEVSSFAITLLGCIGFLKRRR